MDNLDVYSIPLSGLKDGVHQFDYHIDKSFFKHFPTSPIVEGNFDVQVNLDKKPNVIDVLFHFNGTMNTPCDRCLAEMQLPIDGQERLLIKYSEDFKEEAEVVYLPYETPFWNVATCIYEFICLTIPLIKTCDLSGPTCDKQMLSYLNKKDKELSKPEENPIWAQLKNIKLD